MVVHHVEVDPVGAGRDDVAHLLAEPGEIGGQDGRGDAVAWCSWTRFSQMAAAGLPPRKIARWPGTSFASRSQPAFLPEQSRPAQGVFSFAYTITITNTGEVAGAADLAPLDHHRRSRARSRRSRAWAWSATSRCCKPGESFEYTSGCRLRTPSGTMHGSYFCVAEDGERFEVEIAAVPAGRRQPPRAALTRAAGAAHGRVSALSYRLR